MKIKKGKFNLPLLILGIVVLLLFISFAYPKVSQEKIYTSEVLKISFVVPRDLEVSERFASITIKKGNDLILLNRNGTNFSNLNDYLADLSEKNKFELTNQNKLNYNNADMVTGYINGDKIYFIYVKNWVFSLSTTPESLYNDLDQIARSFRYTGE